MSTTPATKAEDPDESETNDPTETESESMTDDSTQNDQNTDGEANQQPTSTATPNHGGQDSSPSVNMGTMYGGVEIEGGSGDSLDDVTEAAADLMGTLADEFKGIQASMDGDGNGGGGNGPENQSRHYQ